MAHLRQQLSYCKTGRWKMRCRMTKPTKWLVRPAKTQISLGIRPVWSESSLSAWRNIGPLTAYWAHSEDYDQTGWISRLIWVFAGRTSHFAGFVVWRLKWFFDSLVFIAQKWNRLSLNVKINPHLPCGLSHPFSVLGVSGVLFQFYSIFDRNFC